MIIGDKVRVASEINKKCLCLVIVLRGDPRSVVASRVTWRAGVKDICQYEVRLGVTPLMWFAGECGGGGKDVNMEYR